MIFNLLRSIYRYLKLRPVYIYFLAHKRRYQAWFARFKPKLVDLVKMFTMFNQSGNVTYDLTAVNKVHLAFALSTMTGEKVDIIETYINELEVDNEIQEFLINEIIKYDNWFITELYGNKIRFRERIAVYALVRIMKPNMVIESGVWHGITSCVVAKAIMKNKAEGYSGYYTGVDTLKDAGHLFNPPYSSHGQIVINSFDKELASIEGPVDLFIHDSAHETDAKRALIDYNGILPKLSDQGIILTWTTPDTLMNVSRGSDRNYLHFHSKSNNPIIPDGRIGFSFKRKER